MSLCDPTVFVVENDTAVRESMAAMVASMNLNCRSFSSAEQFLEGFDPSRPGCIVIDIKLEGMNGLELQGQLVRRDYSQPVICVSGYLDVPVTVRAMRNGAVTVLEKPCQAYQFADAVHKAVDICLETHESRGRLSQIQSRFSSLQPRESEVMIHIINGLPNKSIAQQLDISLRTVSRIRADLFKKIGAKSVTELFQMAVEFWKSQCGAK